MKTMDYEAMTVEQLRAESRSRGLTLQEKGKKFTKVQLIERLKNQETAIEQVVQKLDKAKEPEPESAEETPVEVKPRERKKTGFELLVEKYSGRKPQEEYDNNLKVGCFVAFVHYTEAKDGNIYKRFRTAKVVAINRKKEKVRVCTLLGSEVDLRFEDLLYIKPIGSENRYPDDMIQFMRNRRTEKGWQLMHEKFK